MTIKETLILMRPIMAKGSEASNSCGCIEDALIRVVFGKSWFGAYQQELEGFEVLPKFDHTNELMLYSHKVYQFLQFLTKLNHFGYRTLTLWEWSDAHTKKERLALIDEAVSWLSH